MRPPLQVTTPFPGRCPHSVKDPRNGGTPLLRELPSVLGRDTHSNSEGNESLGALDAPEGWAGWGKLVYSTEMESMDHEALLREVLPHGDAFKRVASLVARPLGAPSKRVCQTVKYRSEGCRDDKYTYGLVR